MCVALGAMSEQPQAAIPDADSAATEPAEPVLVYGSAPNAVSVLLEVDVYFAQ
jgi:hypothetical protein